MRAGPDSPFPRRLSISDAMADWIRRGPKRPKHKCANGVTKAACQFRTLRRNILLESDKRLAHCRVFCSHEKTLHTPEVRRLRGRRAPFSGAVVTNAMARTALRADGLNTAKNKFGSPGELPTANAPQQSATTL